MPHFQSQYDESKDEDFKDQLRDVSYTQSDLEDNPDILPNPAPTRLRHPLGLDHPQERRVPSTGVTARQRHILNPAGPQLPDLNSQLEAAVQRRCADLNKSLRDAQLENGKLKDEVRSLRTQIQQYQNRLRSAGIRFDPSNPHQQVPDVAPPAEPSPAVSQPESKGPTTGSADKDKSISKWARQETLFGEMFDEKGRWGKPKPLLPSTDPARWTNVATRLEGKISELYEGAPSFLCSDIERSASCYEVFKHHRGQFIRSQVTQTRKLAPRIFGLPTLAQYYSKSTDRSKVHEFTSLLVWTEGTPGVEDMTPEEVQYCRPILYPNGVYNAVSIFRDERLPLILRLILFGETSVTDPQWDISTAEPNSKGKKWGSTEVTPGSIAFASTLAIAVHMVDTTFKETGPQSGFSYSGAFDFFKEAILRAIFDPDLQDEMKETMLMWNEVVFKDKRRQVTPRSNAWRREEGMVGLLGRMQNARLTDADLPPVPPGASGDSNRSTMLPLFGFGGADWTVADAVVQPQGVPLLSTTPGLVPAGLEIQAANMPPAHPQGEDEAPGPLEPAQPPAQRRRGVAAASGRAPTTRVMTRNRSGRSAEPGGA